MTGRCGGRQEKVGRISTCKSTSCPKKVLIYISSVMPTQRELFSVVDSNRITSENGYLGLMQRIALMMKPHSFRIALRNMINEKEYSTQFYLIESLEQLA